MSERLNDLVVLLVDATVETVLPLRGDGPDGLRERLYPALAEALRSAVRPAVAPDRLDTCATDAARMIAERTPEEARALVADLLRQVREADQREEWIRAGYSADARRAWQMAEDAMQENGALRHAVRVVKRATRDVRVGRE